MKTYVCSVCGYVYEEEKGIPSAGIAPGTRWEELPADWVCPLCGAGKSAFKEKGAAAPAPAPDTAAPQPERELSAMEVSILCSNLARGCEKQYLAEQAAACPHVRLRGLMTIPPVAGPDGNRPFFAKMRQLFVDIRSQMDDNKTSFTCLSMGMSGDYENAVREGATLVRVGTALFGPRPPMHKG